MKLIRSPLILLVSLPACVSDYLMESASVRDVGGALTPGDIPGELTEDPPGIELWIVDLESGEDSTELLTMSAATDGFHVDPAHFFIPPERGKYHAILQFTLVPPPSGSLPQDGMEVLSFDVVINRNRPWQVSLWNDLEVEFTWSGWRVYSM